MKVITKSPRETEKVGERLGKRLKIGDIVLVMGELGAGKSVFVKGVAKGLGVKEMVKSPSFIIIRRMDGIYPFYHIDLYRVEPHEIEELGIFELADNGVVCVEWGDRILPLLKDKRKIVVRIIKIDGNSRKIEIDDTSLN